MARSAMDQQIEDGVEQAAVLIGRFLSGAPLTDQPRAPGALARWQHVLLRLFVLAWAGWSAWTWWGLHLHQRVIAAAVVVAALIVPLVVVTQIRGRGRREHMRTLVVPLSLGLRDIMPGWDDAQRLKAVHIPVDRSFVKIALPDSWNGQEGHEKLLRELVASRMGGRWEGKWNLRSHPFNVVFTPQKEQEHLEVPDMVDFFDPAVQAAIEACEPGELLLGLDERSLPVTKSMTGETPMWALSVGSGGGKSSFLQMIITQLVGQGATVVGCDVKMASISCFEGVQGIHLYTDPGNVSDMRSAIAWVAREVEARNYVKKQDPAKDFQRLTLVLEEGNEFGDASKAWWNDNKEKSDPAADPIWGDIASIMRMGRHVNVTIIGVFQDLRESAVGNRGLRNMFRLLMLGNFNANQWKMIVNTSPVPESVDKAGRMLIIEGNRRVWIQVPYAKPEKFTDHCRKLRQERGYSTLDLYGAPPKRSPQRLPSLLQKSEPIGPRSAVLQAPAPAEDQPADSAPEETFRWDIAEAQLAEPDPGATAAAGGGGAGGPGDRGLEGLEGPQDEVPGDGEAVDPQPEVELLSMPQISELLAEREGIDVKPGTMRVHKNRRPDYPHPAPDGRYTYEALAEYYRRNPPQQA